MTSTTIKKAKGKQKELILIGDLSRGDIFHEKHSPHYYILIEPEYGHTRNAVNIQNGTKCFFENYRPIIKVVAVSMNITDEHEHKPSCKD